jgi:hypothetical protein
MQRKMSKAPSSARPDAAHGICDFDELLHPAQAFEHPSHVLSDPDLTLNEKRAILASWASDACAIEAAPALRHTPAGKPVRFDDIMDALRALDRQAQGEGDGGARWRRVLRRERFSRRSDPRGGNQGHPFN